MKHQASELLRLGRSDVAWMTEVLTQAFVQKDPFIQVFPEPHHYRLTEYFVRFTCEYALAYGECYATRDKQGVALWLKPEMTDIDFWKACRHGIYSAPLTMGPKAFIRFMSYATHTSRLHRKHMPLPHYYLFMLGVHPDSSGKGIGTQLVSCMLDRIDHENKPVFLETQNPTNLPFYGRLGFHVAAEEPFPLMGKLLNWSMVRNA